MFQTIRKLLYRTAYTRALRHAIERLEEKLSYQEATTAHYKALWERSVDDHALTISFDKAVLDAAYEQINELKAKVDKLTCKNT